MYEIKVETVPAVDQGSLPVFAEFDRMIERVRARAYELAEQRGFAAGKALDDWLAAEREICGSAVELTEDKADYVLNVPLPGFEPGEIAVTATPHEVLVRAARQIERAVPEALEQGEVLWSTYRAAETLRRVALAEEVDLAKISATLVNGVLKIVAPKAVAAQAPAEPAAETQPTRIEIQAAAA
jgi:HSP20 family molecular chaperone IbpA